MARTRSSIGVELEFIIAYTTADKGIRNVPQCFQESKGGPLIVPTSVESRPFDAIRRTLGDTITKALEKCRGDYVIESETEATQDWDAFHLRPYQKWVVDKDFLILPSDLLQQEHMGEYGYHPIEIQSPALWATEASFEEIRLVIQALAEEYWILTPTSAGLHFHYGNGKEYIPFKNLRRIAAFLFATDPVIVQLHPESRRANKFCHSNRLYGRAGHGMTAPEAASWIGAQEIEEAAEIELKPKDPTPGHPPSRQQQQQRRRQGIMYKRGDLTGYTFSRDTFDSHQDCVWENTEEGPCPIPQAVYGLLRCVNAPTVAYLMQALPKERPAYNFSSYTREQYERSRMVIRGVLRAECKRTIEFRQPASTVVAEEVVAHGRLVVRLCEFAAGAGIDEIWKIALDCTVAEEDGKWYDVFDLLAEVGFPQDDTRVLQRAVARFRGETVAEEFEKDAATE